MARISIIRIITLDLQLFANEIAIAAPRGTNGIARPLVVPGSRKKRLRWIVCIRRGGGSTDG